MPLFLSQTLKMPIIRHDCWHKPPFVTRWARGICMKFSANEWQSLEVCRWVDHCGINYCDYGDQGIFWPWLVFGRWCVGDRTITSSVNFTQNSFLQLASSSLIATHKSTQLFIWVPICHRMLLYTHVLGYYEYFSFNYLFYSNDNLFKKSAIAGKWKPSRHNGRILKFYFHSTP